MELLKLHGCPKCRGALFIGSDTYGQFITCSSCGWSKDLPADQPLPLHREDADADRPGLQDGCNVSRSCYSCPLEECMWEQPTARKAYVQDQKTLEIFKQCQHLGTARAAVITGAQLGLSSRGVYRALKRSRSAA
jgi:DNA-directed RNA polymerase subunit M/transcription elongation factor TFIIS